MSVIKPKAYHKLCIQKRNNSYYILILLNLTRSWFYKLLIFRILIVTKNTSQHEDFIKINVFTFCIH